MGRGRQKAKNTKVARELKYFSPNTDLTALQAELGTSSDEQEYEDKWADLYPEDDSSGAKSEPENPDADAGDSTK
ncbi:MAG: DUF3073 domain-containing protein [Rhodoluna sp.]|nr:DUF3073 domain-containing protein [Rhodoluna sp.]